MKGFTLIELIIVVAMMSIFLGFGFTTYTRNIQNKELDRQVDEFVNLLQLTKTRAMNRDLTGNPTCTNMIGYRVRVNVGSQVYRQQFNCNGTINGVGQQYNMGNIVFTSASDIYVTFLTPFGCSTTACDTAVPTITFRNPNNSQCKDVNVNRLGVISVGEQYAC